MVYGWVVILQVVDAELDKAKGLGLASRWCVSLCKPQ